MKIKTLDGVVIDSIDNKMIIESALLQGVVFNYSCLNGKCGVCKVKLEEGEVGAVVPQAALTEQDIQKGYVLACCCEPKTSIVIDAENLAELQDFPVKTFPARISALDFLSDDIVTVTLRLPPSSRFRFLDGQYVDVILNGERRCYSLLRSDDKAERITLLIKRLQGGMFSDYWFERAKLNDLLRLEGPKGTFFLRGKKPCIVFLATGTGIAPVVSMLKKIKMAEDEYKDKEVFLFWGNRRQQDFVEVINFELPFVKTRYVLSSKTDHSAWNGAYGYVQDVALKEIGTFEDAEVYACGSLKMIDSARALMLENGLPERSFFSDAFVPNGNA